MSGSNPGPFVKLYATIRVSSVWDYPSDIRIVWITMLSMADADGNVFASVSGLRREANVSSNDIVQEALELFLSPDDDSRTAEWDGRRISRIEGGWHILNAQKYREYRSASQIKSADRSREYRQRQRDASRPSRTDVDVDVENQRFPNVERQQGAGQNGRKPEAEVDRLADQIGEKLNRLDGRVGATSHRSRPWHCRIARALDEGDIIRALGATDDAMRPAGSQGIRARTTAAQYFTGVVKSIARTKGVTI